MEEQSRVIMLYKNNKKHSVFCLTNTRLQKKIVKHQKQKYYNYTFIIFIFKFLNFGI